MWITKYRDYKPFLKRILENFPKNGRGQSRRLADHLGVAPVVVSTILNGDRHFTIDQAVKVAAFYRLDPFETDYFIYLVNQARADTRDARTYYENKLEAIREEAKKIKNLVSEHEDLPERDKAIYYSNWYYAAISILTSIKDFDSVDKIAEYFDMEPTQVAEIVNFLVKSGICINEDGKIRLGSMLIHITPESPFINNHRRNWREKAKEKFTKPDRPDLFYSSPVSMSEADAEIFRKEIMEFIDKFSKRVKDSPEESLYCLNIDWFTF